MKKKIKIGLDFDGVIAYNPFRILRAPLAFFKKDILGKKKLKFWFPKTRWQQVFWIICHESSVFPAKGIGALREMIKNDAVEVHIITGRYSFLDSHLSRWLDRYNLKNLFKTINTNKNDEQPHLFKEKMIRKYDLDVFVEDNWDIVNYLNVKKVSNIYWIYNVFDRNIEYKNKYPYLEKALKQIHKIHLSKKDG